MTTNERSSALKLYLEALSQLLREDTRGDILSSPDVGASQSSSTPRETYEAETRLVLVMHV